MKRLLLPGALALLAACSPGGEVAPVASPGGFSGLPFPAVLAACAGEAGQRLEGYTWRGRGTVPWPFEGAPERLHFGPVGRTPSTLLYLTFEGPVRTELGGATPVWSAELPRELHSAGEGRFGAGLALAAGERVVLAPPGGVPVPALTIELWLRLERAASGPILSVPGLLALAVDGGRLELEVPGAEGRLESAPLASGRWSHVGVVLDPEGIGVARLVLDDQVWWTTLAPDALAPLERLELGGGGLGFRADELRLSARAANTSELIEAFEARAGALELLELATASGPRALEVWTSFLQDPVVDEPAELARGVLEHVVPGADGLRWTEGHWRRIRALDPPLARTCHPSVYLGDGRILVFSGEVRDSHAPPVQNVADTWIFHTRSERWELLAPTRSPPGRCHQQAALAPEHGLVLLPGGWGNGVGQDVKYADTWAFDAATGQWEERDRGATSNMRGGEHALVYHPGLERFLMFSGSTVSAYDPRTDEWKARRIEVVDESGSPSDYPMPHSMSACYDPEHGSVVLFGGQRGGPEPEFSDRTVLYEPGANRLVVLATAEAPPPRVRPGFAYDSREKRIVLFGGVREQFSARLDDLWSFDPARRRWTRLAASGTPSARGGYMHMVHEPELERFFLLCGRHAAERFLEEAWTLELDERATGRARYAFDRAGFGAAREWFWEGTTPGESALEFRFRASDDGLEWGEWSAHATSETRFLEVEVTLRRGPSGEAPVLRSLGFRARA